jgi:hypothetical protein
MANISTLIPAQLSQYVVQEFPKFVVFMETYFKFLEQQGMPADIILNQSKYDDIDRTLTTFVPYFKKEYAEFFPDTALVDKRLLIKHIKDFYLAKGSEQAFKIFFQMVYGLKIQLAYPSDDILRASDGDIFSKKIITRVSKRTSDPFKFSGHTFSFVDNIGTVIKTAFCESVQQFTTGSLVVYELTLKTIDINYNYIDIDAATRISATIDGVFVDADLYLMAVDYIITNAGTNYNVGDYGVVSGADSGARIKVSRTDITTKAITQLEIEDFGVGFSPTGTLTFKYGIYSLLWSNIGTSYNLVTSFTSNVVFRLNGDTKAIATLILGKIGIFPRVYSSEVGKISSDNKLQDNYYYQIHSYEIQSNLSIDTWNDALRDNAHIAGTKSFGSLALNNSHSIN